MVLEVEATAILGTGKQHSKWAPGHIYFKHKTVLKAGNVKNPEEVAKACPPGVFEVRHGKLIANEALLLKYDLAGVAPDNAEPAQYPGGRAPAHLHPTAAPAYALAHPSRATL